MLQILDAATHGGGKLCRSFRVILGAMRTGKVVDRSNGKHSCILLPIVIENTIPYMKVFLDFKSKYLDFLDT